jgi:hypothetical protein
MLLYWAGTASATQTHGETEGLYSHLIAHLFFLTAMVYFTFRLIKSQIYTQRGWGSICLAAIFFSLWNGNTLLVHVYRETLSPDAFSRDISGLAVKFHASSLLDIFYYMGRFDHLLSFPALLFLLFGVRTLLREEGETL